VILYLVRHGQTAYNRDGLGLGRADLPLTEEGLAQAAAIAERLAHEPIEHVYSSPLRRALDTARPIAEARGLAVEVREELIELDVGNTEGLTFAAMRERYAEFLAEWAGPAGHTAAMPGGESLAHVDERLAPFLDELRRAPHAAAAIVSHNFVIRLAICRLLGLGPAGFRAVSIDVASVSAVRLEPKRTAVMFTNDTCHLQLEPSTGRP
jgi:broad specificity phosphatase PhoE